MSNFLKTLEQLNEMAYSADTLYNAIYTTCLPLKIRIPEPQLKKISKSFGGGFFGGKPRIPSKEELIKVLTPIIGDQSTTVTDGVLKYIAQREKETDSKAKVYEELEQ